MLSVLLGVLGGFQSSEFAMGKTLSLTEVQRTQIVTLHGEDYTEMDTAPWQRCTMLLSKSMVVHGRLYTAQWADGNVFIKDLLQENRAILHLSSSTVSIRLSKEFWLKSYRPAWKPHLTPVMKKKRLDFFRHHRHWTLAEWGESVVFWWMHHAAVCTSPHAH